MNNTFRRLFWWAFVFLYIGCIYSTGLLQAETWSGMGKYGVQAALWGLRAVVVLLFIFVLYRLLTQKTMHLWKFLLFGAFLGLFYFITYYVVNDPKEKFHLIEYGFLAVLVYNALRQHLDRFRPALYVCGILFCITVGVIDEVLQINIPVRSAQLRDVFINSVGIITVFLAIRFHVLRKTFWNTYFGDLDI